VRTAPSRGCIVPTSASRETRPRVALVALEVDRRHAVGSAVVELVRRAHDRVEFAVVSRTLDEGLRAHVRWHRVPVPELLPRRLRLGLFFALAAARLRTLRPELVHLAAAYPLVPSRVDLASVHFCHAAFGTPGLAGRLAEALERRCYGRARRLVALSGASRRELERLFPGVPVVTIPNGVDGERFRPDRASGRELRAQERVGDQDVVCLFVGKAWERKRLALALEGLAHADGLRLWVVGPGDRRRYAALAAGLGVGDRVSVFGARDDVERFYQAADLFCLPSAWEAFPLAALEAAAAGLPLVATRAGGLEELLADGSAGMLVEPEAGALGEAFRALAADRALRELMGREARARGAAHTWQRSVELVLALYRELLREAGRPAAAAARGGRRRASSSGSSARSSVSSTSSPSSR
jgi:glycosyltransferase involved in cell wall biosynthesis